MTWNALINELTTWKQENLCVTMWWRDDDAGLVTSQLIKLKQLAQKTHIPLALATIPAIASSRLATFVRTWLKVSILQHGYQHSNHAHHGERKTELSASRPLDIMLDELQQGAHHLATLFNHLWLPVLVPPWNRLTETLIPELAYHGYIGLSRFQNRSPSWQTSALIQINTHVDIIDWQSRSFVGESVILSAFTRQLQQRRLKHIDPTEPTGLLTHHWTHDQEAWNFLENFFIVTSHHGVHWLDAHHLFSKRIERSKRE